MAGISLFAVCVLLALTLAASSASGRRRELHGPLRRQAASAVVETELDGLAAKLQAIALQEARRRLGAWVADQVLSGAPGIASPEKQPPLKPRRLNLLGELEVVGRWSCENEGCVAPHKDVDVTSGGGFNDDDEITEVSFNGSRGCNSTTGDCAPVAPPDMSHCTEVSKSNSLERTVDTDLTCSGFNLTCDDLGRLPQHVREWEMFKKCNHDPELLYGKCSVICRFERYPTQRCTYIYDRNHKYGLRSDAFDRCLVQSSCHERTTHNEEFTLTCNRSVVPVDAETTYFTKTVDEPEEEDSSILMIAIIAVMIAGVAIGLLVVSCVGRMVRSRKETSNIAGGSHAPEVMLNLDDDPSLAGNGTVVVGRPVANADAPAPPEADVVEGVTSPNASSEAGN
eukprot:TRINITY_DN6859_c0_g1_i3.p1 TRINITY_DN6859_c0_g1~~TRINITY_DN6859_c0_g1_i3.p1  ORF type:complete len:425 (-),score=30.53 TRINITY_DN6859_c0_g1_i3:75-1265(-)